MGKTKIVLDTNILISALGWEGKPKKIFRRVLDGEFELIMSEKQLEELKEVMNYPRLGFTEIQKRAFLEILLQVATLVTTEGKLKVIQEDPDDDMILESAIENNVHYIISGDKHLLRLKEFKNIKIVTVSKYLEEMDI